MSTELDLPHKDLSFPSTPLGKALSSKASVNSLRISTYPKANLPERYNSDEEEPSPSPDNSDTASVYEELDDEEEEELKHKSAQRSTEEDDDLVVYEDYSAEIAVAVPIVIMGPPKLVDITKLAPIQRRKRGINHPTLQRAAMKNAGAMASRSPAFSDSSVPTAPSRTAPNVPKAGTTPSSKVSSPTAGEHIPRRQDSLPDLDRFAPDSWLPEDDGETILESVEEQDDLYFPALDVRPSPTYHDYDPYSLNPPSLSPRSSLSYKSSPMSPSFPSPHHNKKQPGSIARARKNSNQARSSMNNNGGWKGITRTLSIAKRQEETHPQAKKPKMIARGPTERQEMPSLPPFPFEEKKKTTTPRLSTNMYAGSTTALSLKS